LIRKKERENLNASLAEKDIVIFDCSSTVKMKTYMILMQYNRNNLKKFPMILSTMLMLTEEVEKRKRILFLILESLMH
jgi:hypothetical protein